MATVYILYSRSINRYYIGSCVDITKRIIAHNNGDFEGSYTRRSSDWELFYSKEGLGYKLARKLELHIKSMKSRKYLEDLKKYPEIMERLLLQYGGMGSSRVQALIISGSEGFLFNLLPLKACTESSVEGIRGWMSTCMELILIKWSRGVSSYVQKNDIFCSVLTVFQKSQNSKMEVKC